MNTITTVTILHVIFIKRLLYEVGHVSSNIMSQVFDQHNNNTANITASYGIDQILHKVQLYFDYNQNRAMT